MRDLPLDMLAQLRHGAPSEPKLGHAESAAQLFYARLKGADWHVTPDAEPLALCFCMLVLRLKPTLHPRSLAAIINASADHGFDRMALVNTMAALGYRYDRVRLMLTDLDIRVLPALIVGRDGQALVYYRDGDDIALFDGATRQLVDPTQYRQEVEVYLFSRLNPDDLATSQTRREATQQAWFLSLFSRFWPHLRSVVLMGISLNLLALLVPALILAVYAFVIDSGQIAPLQYLAAGAALLLGFEFTLRRLRSRVLTWMMARLDYLVGVSSYDKLLGLSAEALNTAGVSSQIARIKTFEAVRDFLCGPLILSAIELPVTVLALVALFWIGGTLAVPILVAIIVLVAITLIARRGIAVRIRQSAVEGSKMQQFILDTFTRLESIRLDGLAGIWMDRFLHLSGREQFAMLRMSRLAATAEILAHLTVGLATLGLLFIGTKQIWAGELAAGALIAAMMLQLRALAPLHAIVGMLPRIEQLRNAIEQIDRLMDMSEEIDLNDHEEVNAAALNGQIRIRNVSLRYGPKVPAVLSGFSIDIAEGEVIGITGGNGSGKSTLLKLPLGLSTPQLGAVQLGGFDIRQFNAAELRERVAYFPQTVDLFSGTLADNLRIAMPIARNADLEAALEEAGALNQLRSLPDGLQTVVDPARLSASQPLLRERIGLARALLRPAQVLLIDERPAMALLAGLDRDIERVLKQSRGHKTTLFVSSRTDFLRLADRVIAMTGDGRAQVGPLDKIMRTA
ncbi:ATP-binding cassette subfamily B protein/ATP-binding cassette subfamily C protein LapB [Rhodobacter aestuarii]|uniref:ATP-binding cassette, subfamily B/ATP-binding cassette, subfamily C, LapB n=1 Tax=Rhodobacter aestuarii TaxID=453582 RepID=A0A1N7IY31_9RHOB|nr:ATP-binding cassette domain-containing protein [Rhodobacter aestuarii]PTV97409.1 ATP-binding cassette subfamily B protein/ATP-binding cassette subfamily C protein LapB [Rhodobacter aestuarii]SIS41954.1 ATP-binding cassette, subfamily B/ATP-binding cassette, subfamily C, LapB [Rhodobacter aestuarii]